jgi:hypothetical protein
MMVKKNKGLNVDICMIINLYQFFSTAIYAQTKRRRQECHAERRIEPAEMTQRDNKDKERIEEVIHRPALSSSAVASTPLSHRIALYPKSSVTD